MNDSTDLHTCSLEMKGGLNGIDYPQKFVKAPLSQHPAKSPNTGKNISTDEVMRCTLGR